MFDSIVRTKKLDKVRIGPELKGSTGVLLGLSGGADSTALLRVLLDTGCRVYAVHCNFHLRGEESDRDMRFCEELCRALGVSLDILHFNVEEYMQIHSVGLEEACRELRYKEFRRLKQKYGCRRIAVAHNADDNIETLLLNIFRGSGIKGLRGMLPDTGEVARPLLEVSRKQIIDYLDSIGQDYIIDSTNLKSDVKRNFIRNELLPLAETRWPGLRKAVTATLRNLRSDEAVIDSVERKLLGPAGEPSPVLAYKTIKSAPDAEWIIHRWGSRHGLGRHSAGEISAHIHNGTIEAGKKWAAGEGHIYSTRRGLEYIAAEEERDDGIYGAGEICDAIEAELTDALRNEIKGTRGNDVIWLPYPPERYIMRRPRAGDRIWPLGMRGSQLVGDILRDAGVPLNERKRLLILCDGSTGEVLWVPGIKRSRHQLLGEPDKKAWHLKIADGERYIKS